VGAEVISALGDRAVYRPGKPGKFMLNLEQSAKLTVERALDRRCGASWPRTATGQGPPVAPMGEILCAGLCTMCHPDFFSQRRDGRGRNLTFLG
jgi:copper oxidase (laccase) domain-containing protein